MIESMQLIVMRGGLSAENLDFWHLSELLSSLNGFLQKTVKRIAWHRWISDGTNSRLRISYLAGNAFLVVDDVHWPDGYKVEGDELVFCSPLPYGTDITLIYEINNVS